MTPISIDMVSLRWRHVLIELYVLNKEMLLVYQRSKLLKRGK